MPIYEFECNKCKSVTESLEAQGTVSIESPCCDNGISYKIASMTVGRVVGGTPRMTDSKLQKTLLPRDHK